MDILPTEPGWGEEPPSAWGELGTVDGGEPVETLPGAYHEFYRGVAECLLDGAAPPVAVADAVTGIQIIEAAKRSAGSGGVVTIADPT